MLKSKFIVGVSLSLALLLLLTTNVTASSSPNYTLESSVIGSAGGLSTSTNYRSNNTVGQASPIGTSSGLNYIEKAGYQPTTVDNHPPRANAGFDQHVSLNESVVLDASRSYDPDGDLLTFRWTLTRPDGSDGTSEITNTTNVNPTFVVSQLGTYTASVTVSDQTFVSLQDIVLLSTENVPPIAKAGADQSVSHNDVVTLNGAQSHDPEQEPLTYRWTLIKPDGSIGTSDLSDATIANPTFSITTEGTYGATLTVNDGTFDSEPDTAILSTSNVVPIAKTTHSQPAYVHKEILLDASNSFDPDGMPITSYTWAFTHKPSSSLATLLNPKLVNTSFTIDLPGTYIVALTVGDGTLSSFPDIKKMSTTTHQQAIVSIINEAITILKSLDATQLISRNSADTLISKLETILKKLSKSNTNRLIHPLKNDILPKIDGCALRDQVDVGSTVRDWVTDCEPQKAIYFLIVEAIQILKHLK